MVHSQPARIASLLLLIATIFKCFIHDLDRLGELYHVASFVGLGVCLVPVAVARQKFVLTPHRQASRDGAQRQEASGPPAAAPQ
jgi:uncharacterized membrane protein